MRRFRELALGLALLGIAACATYAPTGQTAPQLSPDEVTYLRSMNTLIDAMIEKYSATPKKPVRFSANMIFAYGTAIRKIPVDMLFAYADALKQAGARRIDFNPSIASLTDPVSVAKYDALIAYIRGLGLSIGVNPEYELPDDFMLTTMADYERAAVAGEAAFAVRYKPDYVVVIHEPTTMDARRTRRPGERSTPEQWRDFVAATARAVKAASPTTRVGAGAFTGDGREIPYFGVFTRMPELDFVTVDNYFAAPSAMEYLDQMVEMARGANKPIYMEETWRPEPLRALPSAGQALESAAAHGVGYKPFEPVDLKWLRAMVLYASTHGLDTVTAFWTPCFFLYVDSGPDHGTDAAYNERVGQSLMNGGRTDTFRAYQALAEEFGAR